MATIAGVRCIGIVTLVTSIAIIRNRNVRACKRINGVVIKRGWCPSRLRVASGTLRWELGRCVVRIGRSCIICIVATIAGVWGIGIVTVVTSVAIVGNRHVSAYKRVNRIVIKRRWRPSCFAVASRAIRWELSGCVVRSGCGSIIAVVTGVTSVRCCIVIPVVASSTIACNGRVRAVQGVVIIVDRESCWFPSWCGGVAHRTIRWDG